jgi:hypothetical protein
MREAAGARFEGNMRVDYGGALRDEDYDIVPRSDGAVADIGVEIEAGASKHARGAILDLINSEYRSKLLIIIEPPDWRGYGERIRRRCERILGRELASAQFRVVRLDGNAGAPAQNDLSIVRGALRALGWNG